MKISRQIRNPPPAGSDRVRWGNVGALTKRPRRRRLQICVRVRRIRSSYQICPPEQNIMGTPQRRMAFVGKRRSQDTGGIFRIGKWNIVACVSTKSKDLRTEMLLPIDDSAKRSVTAAWQRNRNSAGDQWSPLRFFIVPSFAVCKPVYPQFSPLYHIRLPIATKQKSCRAV